MAKTVFILGAGASKSAGAPLMEDFLEAALNLRDTDSSHITTGAFDTVAALLQDKLQLLHSKSVVRLEHIEDLFGLVEMGELLGRLPATGGDELPVIATAMRRVLAETVEETIKFKADKRTGHLVPTESYAALATHLSSAREHGTDASWAFVTFNYDVALDFALHWSNLEIDYGVSSSSGGAIPVLKLHGSVNWARCTNCGALQVLGLDRYFKDRHRSPRSGWPASAPIRVSRHLGLLGSHCENSSAPSEPALVPPSWNKTQYKDAFAPIWRRAADEIREAETIVVVGYSLPASDLFFRHLLAVSLAGPARVREFRVVNPNGAVAGQIRSLLGPTVQSKFVPDGSNFEQYVSQNFQTDAQAFHMLLSGLNT